MGQPENESTPRSSRRIAFLRPVHLRPLEKVGPARRMFAANLSKGGMFVRSPQPLRAGARVEVLLEAKGRALPFAEAVVAFSLPRDEAVARGRLPGMGLQFTHLPPRSRALVHQLLRMVPELPAKPELPPHRRGAVPAALASTRKDRRNRRMVRAAAVAAIAGAMALAWSQFPGWVGH